LEDLNTRSASFKKKLIELMLEDMVFDHALASALDEVGMILEYQAQNEGIECPEFNGQGFLKASERVSRLRFTVSLGALLGLPQEAQETLLRAEVDRLWGEGHGPIKDKSPTLKLPEEVVSILRDISSVRRRGNGYEATNNRATEPKPRRPGAGNKKKG
jgi:hypothetical protein